MCVRIFSSISSAWPQLWARFERVLPSPFDTYRPERHYMRGTGPKSRAKDKPASQPKHADSPKPVER